MELSPGAHGGTVVLYLVGVVSGILMDGGRIFLGIEGFTRPRAFSPANILCPVISSILVLDPGLVIFLFPASSRPPGFSARERNP